MTSASLSTGIRTVERKELFPKFLEHVNRVSQCVIPVLIFRSIKSEVNLKTDKRIFTDTTIIKHSTTITASPLQDWAVVLKNRALLTIRKRKEGGKRDWKREV
jgi:hypothetical protein